MAQAVALRPPAPTPYSVVGHLPRSHRRRSKPLPTRFSTRWGVLRSSLRESYIASVLCGGDSYAISRPASAPHLLAGPCVAAGPLGPLVRWPRASCPSRRSVQLPCRPDAARRARPGRLGGRGGSLRAAWVVCVLSPRLSQRYLKAPGSHPYSPECVEGKSSELRPNGVLRCSHRETRLECCALSARSARRRFPPLRPPPGRSREPPRTSP